MTSFPRALVLPKGVRELVFHELNGHNAYRGAMAEFALWQLSSGLEVDFIATRVDIHNGCGMVLA